MFKTLQTFLLEKNNTYSENPMSKGLNGVKLQVIKEIHISRCMTIYGQTLGVFKRENHECICNGEKTKLHKIKIVVGDMKRISSQITSLWRQNDVIRDEIRVIDHTS